MIGVRSATGGHHFRYSENMLRLWIARRVRAGVARLARDPNWESYLEAAGFDTERLAQVAKRSAKADDLRVQVSPRHR